MRKPWLIAAGLLSAVGLAACKQQASTTKKKDEADALPTATPSYGDEPTARPTRDCEVPVPTPTLGLTSTYDFEADIGAIIAEKCLSCHSSGSANRDLTSYANVKSAASLIKSQIENGAMPPSNASPLSAEQKSKILTWIDQGAAQTSSSTADNDSGGTDCEDVNDNSTSDDTASSWEEILNTSEFQACQASGKVYRRTAKTCHYASIATSYQCDRQGIIDKFKQLNMDATSFLDNLKNQGYSIDQCGEHNGEPFVYFYRPVETELDITLEVRCLRKQSSTICMMD